MDPRLDVPCGALSPRDRWNRIKAVAKIDGAAVQTLKLRLSVQHIRQLGDVGRDAPRLVLGQTFG
jgi:hypothetical protein